MALPHAYTGRIEDQRLVTGHGRYIADLTIDGMAHAVVVRAPMAHARIGGIRTEAARGAPGILAVLTGADLAADGVKDLPCGIDRPRLDGSKAFQTLRPPLARDRVRYVGEGVALVVAETRAAALDAAELVDIDYDPLDAVTTPAAARAAGAIAVWSEVPDNVACVWRGGKAAETKAALAMAHRVVRLSSCITRLTASPMETRGALGHVESDGRLVLHVSHQSPYAMRATLAQTFGVKPEGVRILIGDVGGSFGMKAGVYPEDVLVLWAARRLGRPVRWIADRTESFLADEHARDITLEAALGLDAEGRFLALDVHFDVNIGAYLSGRSLGFLNNIGGIAGVYRIGAIAAEVFAVHTNTQATSPYRGAGRPEATYVIERLIDLAAREMGMEPFALRRRNLVPPTAMPYDTGFQFTYDCGEFEENMKAAARLGDLAGFAARRTAAKARGKLLGVGFANPIEVAGGPFLKPGKDQTSVLVAPDGTVTIHSGVLSTGQGLETMLSDYVARRLGVPVESVRFKQGDTDLLAHGRGSGGSSATSTGGTATKMAVDSAIDAGRAIAAERLDASLDDVTFEDAHFRVAGTNRALSLAEVAGIAAERGGAGLSALGEFQPPNVTFPNGCHVCEVEVDPKTGEVAVVRYAVVEDIGTVLNPTLAHGQLQGGVAQGLAQALGEALVIDPDSGQVLTGSFMDYTLPRADDLPFIAIETREVPTKTNPLGAKGVGEAGTVGSLSAVINAVCDALAPLGVKHIEMPASPARVWEAIQAAKSG
jgi:carbon-monoxide dehydrogenase large subunit